jgi:hypothetical protein
VHAAVRAAPRDAATSFIYELLARRDRLGIAAAVTVVFGGHSSAMDFGANDWRSRPR